MNRNIRRYLYDGTAILTENEYKALLKRGINYTKEETAAMRTYRKYWAVYPQTYICIGTVFYDLNDPEDLKVIKDKIDSHINGKNG